MTTQPEQSPVINQGSSADTPDGQLPVGHTLAEGEALLSVRNLKKIYHTDGGDIEAVRNLTFDLPKGELTCLVGPSGPRKTTLLKANAGDREPTRGEVERRGRRKKGLSHAGLRN